MYSSAEESMFCFTCADEGRIDWEASLGWGEKNKAGLMSMQWLLSCIYALYDLYAHASQLNAAQNNC